MVFAATRVVLAATRVVLAATREVSAATREVLAATREVSAATREVSAATREVLVATRPVWAATRVVPAGTRVVPAGTRLVPAGTQLGLPWRPRGAGCPRHAVGGYDPLVPHFHLSWSDPHDRLFDVEIRFIAPEDGPRLLLPAWRPGRYLLQDYAANVREWSAGGHAIRKDGKTSWVVEAREGEEVTVRYRYYAGVLDAGSSFLDADEAYWNGSNLFMLVEGLREEEHRLTVATDWPIEIQLPRDGDVFVARDYDHLIDSPAIASPAMTRHSFEVEGKSIHLVFRGDAGIDTRQFVEPHRAMARSQSALFGGLPFGEYRFLYHLRDRWHGVEHEDSCSIIARRLSLMGCEPGDEGYDHLLSIASHELFHAWNVKRMMPAGFLPYDYWRETPTKLLWAMEGITSYYGELTLVRAGLWSESRYLQHIEKEIEVLESSPANRHLSLAQASYDGWLATPAYNHDLTNAWYSFYNKGELVALLLDLTIRQRSGGGKSLDDVMRLLWGEYGSSVRRVPRGSSGGGGGRGTPRNSEEPEERPKGMPEDAIERAVARIADVGDFFARYVDGTEPLPYGELLALIGVEMRSEPRGGIGARFRADNGLLIVDAVFRGGPAMEAGLLPGDELIAIDGTRTTTESVLGSALQGLGDGAAAELLIARAGEVRRQRFVVRPDPRVTVKLRTTGASELRAAWLRRDE